MKFCTGRGHYSVQCYGERPGRFGKAGGESSIPKSFGGPIIFFFRSGLRAAASRVQVKASRIGFGRGGGPN